MNHFLKSVTSLVQKIIFPNFPLKEKTDNQNAKKYIKKKIYLIAHGLGLKKSFTNFDLNSNLSSKLEEVRDILLSNFIFVICFYLLLIYDISL